MSSLALAFIMPSKLPPHLQSCMIDCWAHSQSVIKITSFLLQLTKVRDLIAQTKVNEPLIAST
jgi:hypothetical protein